MLRLSNSAPSGSLMIDEMVQAKALRRRSIFGAWDKAGKAAQVHLKRHRSRLLS